MNENNNENKVQPVINNNSVDVNHVEVLGDKTGVIPVVPQQNSQVQPGAPTVNASSTTVSQAPVNNVEQSVVSTSSNVTPPNNMATSINPMAKAQEQLINRMKEAQGTTSVEPMAEIVIDGTLKKESNVKYILTGLFFVFLLAMVIFLPEVSALVNTIMNPIPEEEVITTGKLVCTINETTEKYTLKYSNTFTFTDTKIKSLNFVSATSGDKDLDKLELEEMNKECKNLSSIVEEYDGINVICNLDSGISTVEQSFNYENIDSELLSAAYTEIGGIYPQFWLDQSIDEVEKSMIASGYSCKRS